MAVTIQQLLDELRASSLDERDKGDKFERLMQAYLLTDPQWVRQFDAVSLWSEWDGREGKVDTGIDLVAENSKTGQRTAIQCKFYASDHTIQKSDLDSFFTASGKTGFSRRLIITTSDKWSNHAEDALKGQQVPTQRLDVSTLNESTVDWSQFTWRSPSNLVAKAPKTLMPHQREALNAVIKGFADNRRGKLIMACGTGKTFTSLRIAEQVAGAHGTVLFLVPSISLLSQSLREWSQESPQEFDPYAVCSDVRVGRSRGEDMSVVDLTEPATTDPATLVKRFSASKKNGISVIFSTYQSLKVVTAAQQAGLPTFDLVICDEAHRTTGVTLADEDESAFVRIHSDDFVKAHRRLYMTATPRIYDDASKSKATETTAVVASMDDDTIYGPEFHRLGFGKAVERNLLSDYKVLVLAVDEGAVSRQFQRQLADEDSELKLDDAAKLVGCWNGLAKRGVDRDRLHIDTQPMRRAVAFAENIKVSKRVARLFEIVSDQLAADSTEGNDLACEAEHVDGTFNILERNKLLDWLRADQGTGNTCRILSNARCLSEGVDVPALDAVIFLNPRNSVVDVVQSVGRVMRRADKKEYGYVILPIGVPADMCPEEALADNSKYKVVWQVLQALRAHDDRFNAIINKIELNRTKDDKLQVIGVKGSSSGADGPTGSSQISLPLSWSDEWRDAIYAKIVAKVGDRRYWEDWAKDIAEIAGRHVSRIKGVLTTGAPEVAERFEDFHSALRANLNDGISRDNAIEMLAQHLITRPVFDALFEGYEFAKHNPVSLVMQGMLDVLDEQGLRKESESLEQFYASVRLRAQGIDNAEGKQRIVTELYEKFFQNAFPKAAESLGIVYTPVEIVDFIIRSVDYLLQSTFGASIADPGVHVLDPFTGTGTFIVRLMQSGLITSNKLLAKYSAELHANEINLLAYYVAAVNIEATFHALHDRGTGTYRPFDGIVLTDTFQMHEVGDTLDERIFVKNNSRVVRQKGSPIRVIVGNPPYSVGQGSANDGNEKLKYPTLDQRIDRTYNRGRGRGGNNALYDSYIRAIRWASDRVGEQGVVAYVCNGGFLDSNLMGGLRKSLVEDFDQIYIYNLRGNGRIAGDAGRREGRPVFEDGRKGSGGSRTTIAILFLVKSETSRSSRPGSVRMAQVADSLTARQKLDVVAAASIDSLDWEVVEPDEHGDWVDQRRPEFDEHPPIGDKLTNKPAIFRLYSRGLETGRDAWVYNFSLPRLRTHIETTADAFNSDLEAGKDVDLNPKRISWTHSLRKRYERQEPIEVNPNAFGISVYRPFTQTNVYYNKALNHIEGRLRAIFPTPLHENFGIYNVGMGSDVPFSALMVGHLPDLHVTGAGSGGQFYPRWTYERVNDDGGFDFGREDEVIRGYRRIDNVSDFAQATFERVLERAVSKDEIFSYVYGLLHSAEYRSVYAGDLKKVLPRIPISRNFDAFMRTGSALSNLHLSYESLEPYPLIEHYDGKASGSDKYRVQKVAFGKGPQRRERDLSRIVVNSHLSLSGIPEVAYRYQVGPRSAVEWIVDRYLVKTDSVSGLINDANDWGLERSNPRYLVDLLARVVRVSVESVALVDALPSLDPIVQVQETPKSR